MCKNRRTSTTNEIPPPHLLLARRRDPNQNTFIANTRLKVALFPLSCAHSLFYPNSLICHASLSLLPFSLFSQTFLPTFFKMYISITKMFHERISKLLSFFKFSFKLELQVNMNKKFAFLF